MAISRREFLASAAGAAVLATGNSFAQQTGSKSEVYVGKGSAAEMLPKILEKMGGISRFVKQDSRVLIKVNMSFPNPRTGEQEPARRRFLLLLKCVSRQGRRG